MLENKLEWFSLLILLSLINLQFLSFIKPIDQFLQIVSNMIKTNTLHRLFKFEIRVL